ncbi:MAG TPA: protein BatD [Verrucomicrobia bacterium]|nr:protein BatD [Verrucomicrobiota bacterium]
MSRILAFSFALLFTANALGQSVSASLDRATTTVGESINLSINCTNFSPSSRPILPSISGLRFSSAGTSRKFQLGGGGRTSTYTFNILVTPLKPGNYSISPIQVRHETRLFKPKPLKLLVLPAGEKPKPGNNQSQNAYVRLLPTKTTAYVGEVIPVEIQLFFIDGVNVQMPELIADGFNIAPFPKHKQTRMQKGNQIYQVLTFRTAATPLKAGKLQLGPVKQGMVLRVRQKQNRRSPFNNSFDGIFTRYQQVPVTLEAKAQTITVKPLPTANKPASFNGAVGRYTMQAKASPLEVTVGDPVTLNIQISGQGAIDSLNLPKLDWPSFKSYEPSVTTNKNNPLGLLGTRTFEQVVIPESDKITEVPRIEFSFFDPVTAQYRVLAKGPLPLKVNPSDEPIAPLVGGNTARETSEPDSPPQTDILTIQHHLGSLGQALPLVARPNFWLLQSIPLLLWLGALLWRRKTNALANNPRLRRKRQVAERTRAGLAKLDNLAKQEETAEFHAELADLLREQLGLRLDIPAEGITADIVHSPAASNKLDEGTRSDIRKLFAASDQATYARSQTTGELNANLALLKEVFSALK